MPNQDLLHAIHRLDQAVSSAEAAIEAAEQHARAGKKQRDTVIRGALSEIDDLFTLFPPQGTIPQREEAHG